MSKPVEFIVRRRRSRYFFKVSVFNTKSQMYTYFRKRGKSIGLKRNDNKLDFFGICMCYEHIDIQNKRMPDIGEVLLFRGKIGAGIVAHEMLHAALHYERLVSKNEQATFTNNIGKEEERLAYCLTDLVRQFTVKAYELGIYP